ncbi:hypothetical protein F5144DRAFT_378840 [Chaetomium tenue]|uniref:Uncharacterized protein n=1 Tax=Chaetomium tenue TaxID=1854479 RepID=A0ACB7NUD0_9PEZI|nr:hypothetical protein F5144DRAFT_378840 [Chaetomium globosum]
MRPESPQPRTRWLITLPRELHKAGTQLPRKGQLGHHTRVTWGFKKYKRGSFPETPLLNAQAPARVVLAVVLDLPMALVLTEMPCLMTRGPSLLQLAESCWVGMSFPRCCSRSTEVGDSRGIWRHTW